MGYFFSHKTFGLVGTSIRGLLVPRWFSKSFDKMTKIHLKISGPSDFVFELKAFPTSSSRLVPKNKTNSEQDNWTKRKPPLSPSIVPILPRNTAKNFRIRIRHSTLHHCTKDIRTGLVIWQQFHRSTRNDSGLKSRSSAAWQAGFLHSSSSGCLQAWQAYSAIKQICAQKEYPTSGGGSTSSCCSSVSSRTRRRDSRNDFFRFFQNFFNLRPTFRERRRRLRSPTTWTLTSVASSETSLLPVSSGSHCWLLCAGPVC